MNQVFTIREGIAKLVEGQDLTREEARSAMADIMDGRATPAQIGSFVTALRMKGETIDEIAGFAETMREKAQRVNTGMTGLLDTCGTGGDGANTFNISTAASIVAAAGGVRVAKHGNRAASSKSGSADVLEALGVEIQLDSGKVADCLKRIGIGFMFAQIYHQSMKHAAAPRRELGVRNVFNLLGPLTNPAGADLQLLGVFDRSKTEVLAKVLRELGTKRALVVSSHDGLDEISISAPTQISELNHGEIRTYDISPEDLGLKRYPLEQVVGGDADRNAQIIRQIFQGKRGAQRDIVLANAAACFYIAGLASTLREGVKAAENIIDGGQAAKKLEELVHFTKELSHVS
jgi:anthranilate phosphoribosyltransferase